MCVGSDQLVPLRQVATKGYRVLDPTGPRQGPCDAAWMIQAMADRPRYRRQALCLNIRHYPMDDILVEQAWTP